MTFIFTALFSARFRLPIHDIFIRSLIVASSLSRAYTIQVKNAVIMAKLSGDDAELLKLRS